MKYTLHIFAIFLFLSGVIFCTSCRESSDSDHKSIHAFLDRWHRDVAEFRETDYFDKMGENFIFIGTDPGEIWNKSAFRKFAHPYFVKKKTWDFTPLERHLYFSGDRKTVWFDELLNTQMGLCRGSGVISVENGHLYLQQYVLSITVSNDDMNRIIRIKHPKDSVFVARHFPAFSR